MNVEAASREDAVLQIKSTMTEDAVSRHMSEKHAGEPVPSVEQVHAMIEEKVEEII